MDDLVLDTKAIRGEMSQAAFAEIAHVDQSSVCLWETDKRVPSRAAAALIKLWCEQNGIEPAMKPLKEAHAA